MMEIYREFRFQAAHRLPHVPPDHKCHRLHGHSYRVRVYIRGPVDKQMGWVCDFSRIKEAFEPLMKQLDHHCLNEIEGLENATSEVLAMWLWERLEQDLPGLYCVETAETEYSACRYYGPDA